MMDFLVFARQLVVLMVLLGVANNVVQGDECWNIQRRCDRETFQCKLESFYADIYSGKICRGCNICIKPGTPVDSKGCPQLPCPEMSRITIAECRKPEVYNSWVMYRGRKCKTCETMFCEIAFKRS